MARIAVDVQNSIMWDPAFAMTTKQIQSMQKDNTIKDICQSNDLIRPDSYADKNVINSFIKWKVPFGLLRLY